MNLKETFKSLSGESFALGLCKFGSIYEDFDPETQEAFRDVLLSPVSTQKITRALNDDGIKIRREHVGDKRRCFLDINKKCCLRPENDTKPKELNEKK